MEYTTLGHTGLQVSRLCLGTMQFGWSVDEVDSQRVLTAAYEAGINFIDTADIYSRWAEGNEGGVAETIIGNWLHSQGIPRDQVVLATKVRGQMGDGVNDAGLSRYHIMNSIDGSLQRLGVDYIDIYQTHSVDPQTPIDETLRALDDLIHSGKVRYIGCSNYPAWRLMEALWISDKLNLHAFVSVQPNYSLVYRQSFEQETMAVCKKYGIGVIPYSPLAGGFLSGKYIRGQDLPDSVRSRAVQERYMTDQNWRTLKRVRGIAEHYQASVSQVSLAWLMNNPVITAPIIGPRTLAQLEDNIGALDVALSGKEISDLDKISHWNQT
ncbi:MAG: aldo/keto reductase [Fidelibacterota bacterium]